MVFGSACLYSNLDLATRFAVMSIAFSLQQQPVSGCCCAPPTNTWTYDMVQHITINKCIDTKRVGLTGSFNFQLQATCHTICHLLALVDSGISTCGWRPLLPPPFSLCKRSWRSLCHRSFCVAQPALPRLPPCAVFCP